MTEGERGVPDPRRGDESAQERAIDRGEARMNTPPTTTHTRPTAVDHEEISHVMHVRASEARL